MNGATAPILAALVAQLGLGLAVFIANPHRKSNQCFLLLSLMAAGWLGSLYGAFTTIDPGAALFMREASAAGVLTLVTLNLLRLSIRRSQEGWHGILRRSWGWLLLTLGIVVLCQTKFFLQGTRMPQHTQGALALPVPVYGNAVYIYAIYFGVVIVALVIGSWRDLRQTTGGGMRNLPSFWSARSPFWRRPSCSLSFWIILWPNHRRSGLHPFVPSFSALWSLMPSRAARWWR